MCSIREFRENYWSRTFYHVRYTLHARTHARFWSCTGNWYISVDKEAWRYITWHHHGSICWRYHTLSSMASSFICWGYHTLYSDLISSATLAHSHIYNIYIYSSQADQILQGIVFITKSACLSLLTCMVLPTCLPIWLTGEELVPIAIYAKTPADLKSERHAWLNNASEYIVS